MCCQHNFARRLYRTRIEKSRILAILIPRNRIYVYVQVFFAHRLRFEKYVKSYTALLAFVLHNNNYSNLRFVSNALSRFSHIVHVIIISNDLAGPIIVDYYYYYCYCTEPNTYMICCFVIIIQSCTLIRLTMAVHVYAHSQYNIVQMTTIITVYNRVVFVFVSRTSKRWFLTLLSEFAPIRKKKNIIKPFEIIHRVQETAGICDYVRNPPIRGRRIRFGYIFRCPYSMSC